MTITMNKPVSPDELKDLGNAPEPLTAEDVETLTQMGYAPITQLPKSDLLAILREHEIMVYLPEDVDSYKTKMVNHARRMANKWIGIGAAAAAGQITAGFLTADHEWLPIALWVTGGITGIATLLYTIGTDGPSAYWDRHPIRSYRQEVPGPVLATIARLRRANSNLEFDIENLYVKPREIDENGIFDPLLFVSLRGARYCIAVWDEPKFNAKPLH